MIKICVKYWVVYCAKASSNFVTKCRVAQVQIRVAAFDGDCDLLLFRDLQTNEYNKKVKSVPAIVVLLPNIVTGNAQFYMQRI